MLYTILYILIYYFFFFNDTATTEIYTLSLHDALPISRRVTPARCESLRSPAISGRLPVHGLRWAGCSNRLRRSEEHTSELQSRLHLVCRLLLEKKKKINKIIVLYYIHNNYCINI